ncbi:hypothetical protein DNM18_25345, partial [Salmonella enterica subsp. enterica]|nr:hypothetical protein [Salmonella enterica subsp. enterica serovar Poona]
GDNSDVIEVPKGFITDHATIPRIFWILLPPDGRYAKAAIIHEIASWDMFTISN